MCSCGLYLHPDLNTFDVSGGFLCLLQDDVIPQMTGQQNCRVSSAAGLPFSEFTAQRHVCKPGGRCRAFSEGLFGT